MAFLFGRSSEVSVSGPRDRRSTSRPPGERGFTLIELLVVVSILGIIGAKAIPRLDRDRRSANEDAAQQSLQAIIDAESDFVINDPDADARPDAANLPELGSEETDFVDAALGGGDKLGFHFKLTPEPDSSHWSVMTNPRAYHRTGDRSFYTDDSEVIRTHCCGDASAADDPVTSAPPCAPCVDPSSAPPPLDKVGIKAIQQMNLLGGGNVLTPAQSVLGDSANVDAVVAAMDRNGDSSISWAEVFGTDLVARARALKTSLTLLPTEGPAIGEDATLAKAIASYQQKLRKTAKFDATEVALPAVQISGLTGDPVAFVELAR